MRKFILLAAGVLLSVGTLAACIGGPPPPPPTDPHDVLVVGDSVAFAFGCVLGDTITGDTQTSCPARPGYTTKNMAIGACTTYGTQVLLYNTGTASVPNCDTTPAGNDNMTWTQAADFFVPKVVIINTAGWEIVDRWDGDTSGAPNDQWGASGCSIQNPCNQQYQNAAVGYTNALFSAISAFRSRGAKVIVATSPYEDGLAPEPDPATTPPGLGCSWWEPYPPSPPTASGGNCTGNAQAGTGGAWRAPFPGLTYRSGRTKLDQLNEATAFVKSQYFNGDSNVRIFPFKEHFNGPNNIYTDYVCPPPHDRDTPAVLQTDVRPGSPTIGQQVYLCDDGSHLPVNYVNAILARDPDRGHLSPAGAFNVLQPYIEPCVQALLGIGGDQSKCS
ncbi:MAG TPA: hypothetical protein VKH17_00385 [Acidimicrobiia bacterium]|nr:hypothetical protein [Acidimicrobiia bacterium]